MKNIWYKNKKKIIALFLVLLILIIYITASIISNNSIKVETIVNENDNTGVHYQLHFKHSVTIGEIFGIGYGYDFDKNIVVKSNKYELISRKDLSDVRVNETKKIIKDLSGRLGIDSDQFSEKYGDLISFKTYVDVKIYFFNKAENTDQQFGDHNKMFIFLLKDDLKVLEGSYKLKDINTNKNGLVRKGEKVYLYDSFTIDLNKEELVIDKNGYKTYFNDYSQNDKMDFLLNIIKSNNKTEKYYDTISSGWIEMLEEHDNTVYCVVRCSNRAFLLKYSFVTNNLMYAAIVECNKYGFTQSKLVNINDSQVYDLF